MVKRFAAAIAMAVIVATAPAWAQQGSSGSDAAASPESGHPAVLSGQHDGQHTTKALLGAPLLNTAGEKVGTVEDLVVTPDGRIAGVIVKLGGVLGIGARSVGIAWDQLRLGRDGGLTLTELTVDELEAAPDYRRSSRAPGDSGDEPGNPAGDPPPTAR